MRKHIHYLWQHPFSEKPFWVVTFRFSVSFPKGCEESSVLQHIKYFFCHLLATAKSSLEQENSWEILSVSQVAMLNMTSLSLNFNCEPPLAVFLALELHSQTRSKKLVKLLNIIWACHIRKSSALNPALHRKLHIEQTTTQIQSALQFCVSTYSQLQAWITWIIIPHHVLQPYPSMELGFHFSVFYNTEAWVGSRMSTSQLTENRSGQQRTNPAFWKLCADTEQNLSCIGHMIEISVATPDPESIHT